jgi:uncharacterized protein
MNQNPIFERGLRHFNAGEFFEAHEAWEELWLAAPHKERPFLQGLIQLAAAFHHHRRGNSRGTRSLLAAGLSKLAGFADNHGGLALAELRAEAGQWVQALAAGENIERLSPPQIRLDAASDSAKKKRGG